MAAPRKKPQAEAVVAPSNLEDLLALSDDKLVSDDNVPFNLGGEPTAVPVDPRDNEIAELKNMVRELLAQNSRPETVVNNLIAEPATPPPAIDPAGDNDIILHFLEDGFLALDRTWYRGQELRIARDSAAWESTKDRNGNSWLDAIDDISLQFRTWGKQMFARGPWPGLSLSEVPVPEELNAAEAEVFRAQLRAAAAKEAERLAKPLAKVDMTF